MVVSFTSILKILSLIAAAQLARPAVIDQSLVDSLNVCSEDFTFNSNNSNELEKLVYDYSSNPPHLKTQADNMSIWRKKTALSGGKFITTIITEGMNNPNQYVVRVDWEQGQTVVSRYFQLEPNMECRVRNSGDYTLLVGATYVAKKTGGP